MLRVAIVHYHLHPGGVTRIIEHAVAALRAGGAEAVILTGEPPEQEWDVPVRVLPALGYEERRPACTSRELAGQMEAAVREALGAPADLWHVHNHSLGKNLAVPGALHGMVGEGRRLLLQIHDFAEEGRPANYRRMLDAVGEGDGARLTAQLYPQAPQVHYAVLNGRDQALLTAAGFVPSRLHSLPNPVSLGGMDAAPPPSAGRRLWLYPTRAIRRKNLGEFLLWAAAARGDDEFGTTLAPRNPLERPAYERWRAVANRLDLPVRFELGEQPGVRFEELLGAAHALVTTSIAEGFGMAFLEPWLAGRAVTGRDLPEITAEFVDVGVNLDGLYERLEVPVEWVGREVLEQAAGQGLQRIMHAYGRQPMPDDVGQVLTAWISDGQVDFGRLDESLQQQVIERVAASASAAAQIVPPRLVGPEQQGDSLARNREAVLENFSLDHYGPRLLEVYREVMETTVESPEALSGEALLDEFLKPERLFLLRT